jgi:hypothetical protein
MADTLTAEQIAHSHIVDDLSKLLHNRTSALNYSKELLITALDAARAGNAGVAEEYLDRALSAVVKGLSHNGE